MNILLYLILLVLPLPLLFFLIKQQHYFDCLPPFVAFVGIYIFIITGSITVINNEFLFSDTYYYTLLFILVSFYFFYAVLFSYKNKFCIDWSAAMHLTHTDTLYIFLVILWSYSFFIFYIYYQRNGLPALFSINLINNDIYAIRAEKSTSLSEGMHWYRFAFTTIPSFIFIFTYIVQYLNPNRKMKFAFYLNLPLVLFFSSLTLHKTSFAYLILYVLLINILLGRRPLSLKTITLYCVAGIGTIVSTFRLYNLRRNIFDFFTILPEYFYHRICVTYTRAHAYILQIFPDQHDFFYGVTLGNPGHIFPYEPISLSQFLGYWVSGGLANYSSPSFSQGYANFGFMGFVLILLLMFLQMILFQLVFKKCPKNPLFLALYVLIVPNMLGYASTSIEAIFSHTMILFSIFCVLAYYFSNDLANRLVNKH